MKYYLNNSYAQMQACSGGQASLRCPERLYLDITQDCNLSCRMCRERVEMTGKTMPFNLFRRLVGETSPYVKNYSLFNWGEPLVVQDFRERVDYVNSVKRKDCSVDISTNGMLLSDEMIGFLRSREVSVIVSFDGADRKTFETIRRGSKFDYVCDRLRRLAGAYAGVPVQKSPRVYTSIQKENQNQLLAIAQSVHSLGIRQMGFGLVTAPAEYAPEADEPLRVEIEKTMAYCDENDMLNDIYPTRVGDWLWWGSRYEPMERFVLDARCTAPLVSASIAYNGNVFLCCNVGEYVDSVADKSFLDVWRGEKYERLRAMVNAEGEMPERCKNCWWVNRE